MRIENQTGGIAADRNQYSDLDKEHHIGIASARECGRMPRPGLAAPPANPIFENAPIYNSPDAKVTVDTNHIVFLSPYRGQSPLRDYPGGKGSESDIRAARQVIDVIPGSTGRVAEVAFALFDQNYNSRLDENHTAKDLKMSDVPAPIVARTAHWKLHYDVDLYAREQYGPLGARDLRPNTDIAPAGGKLPNVFFAVALDAEHKPLDVLKYDDPGTGNRYLGQYQFKYETVNDGDNRYRITVKNWVDFEQNKSRLSGPKAYVGGRLNRLAGVSQYYYDGAGKCTEAEYFPGYTFLKDRSQWQPTTDMKFTDGKANGTVEERWLASRINFFDLLGPRFPKLG